MSAFLYAFAGAVLSFLVLHIQEYFFWPIDLTPHQLQRLEASKWWMTSIGAILGLIFGFLVG